MPGAWQAWPNSAACWSPAMPRDRERLAEHARAASCRTRAPTDATSGRIARGTSSSSQQLVVPVAACGCRRAACARRWSTSVTCARLPVSCQTSHVSTVPNASSPRSARARAPGTLSSSQRELGAARSRRSSTSPVRSRISALGAGGLQLVAQRRRCAGPARRSRWRSARRSARSQSDRRLALVGDADRRDVVARHAGLAQRLARDVALRARRSRSGRARPSPAADRSAGTRAARRATIAPSSSKTIARELVVP